MNIATWENIRDWVLEACLEIVMLMEQLVI